MWNNNDIQNIFFLGIGGIGMSAIARYFNAEGQKPEGGNGKLTVCGYDRTPSPLTRELEQEGIRITYDDDPSVFNAQFALLNSRNTLVVRTPAVPEDSAIYTWLRTNGFDIRKRAEVLGEITRSKRALCVAGTHGKTTTSTMLAHLLNTPQGNQSTAKGVNAFLGGISMNYSTNVLIDPDSDYVVVEADEYDRSFHHLTPYISVITAVDPDHLDIYGTPQAYREAFEQYTSLVTGALVIKHGLPVIPRLQSGVKCYTYGIKEQMVDDLDFYAANIRVGEGTIVFDFHTPDSVIADIQLGVPVWVNIENAVAAMAVAWLVKKENGELKNESDLSVFNRQLSTFRGVQRRFNIHVNTDRVVYIDDYAHHPDEIATSIDSVRKLYPHRRLIGVFQPHLYTRTRDFADGFARVLATLDKCILLPIYPAREKPISGVTSDMLSEKIESLQPKADTIVVEKNELVPMIKELVLNAGEPLVLMTIGAGDIDRLVTPLAEAMKS